MPRQLLTLIINLNLHNRSRVRPMRPNHVINRAQNDNAKNNQDAPVHRRQRHRCRLRPETEEQDDEHKYAREPVRNDAQYTRYSPRAPTEILSRRSRGIGNVASGSRAELSGFGGADVARDATPEKQCADDEVGGVEPVDGEGKQVGESGWRADGDEPQKYRHDGRHKNRIQRDKLVRVDLAYERMPRHALVTCKCPQHARCRGQEPDGRDERDQDDDGAHDRRARGAVRRIQENAHEGVGHVREDGGIAEAEEFGQQHGEAKGSV